MSSQIQSIREKDFEETNAISYETAQNVKVGMFVFLNNRLCKVLERVSSKQGKHGSARICLLGQDVILRKNVEALFKTSDRVSVLPSYRKECLLTDVIHDGYGKRENNSVTISFMDLDTNETQTANIDVFGAEEKLVERLLAKFAEGESLILQFQNFGAGVMILVDCRADH